MQKSKIVYVQKSKIVQNAYLCIKRAIKRLNPVTGIPNNVIMFKMELFNSNPISIQIQLRFYNSNNKLNIYITINLY